MFSSIFLAAVGFLGFIFPSIFISRKIFFLYRIFRSSLNPIQDIVNNMPISPLTRFLTNKKVVDVYAKLYIKPELFTYEKILGYKELTVWGVILIIIAMYSGGTSSEGVLCFGAVGLVFSFKWPELFLRRQKIIGAERNKNQLPKSIDLMQIYVSAGYNLEYAIIKAGQNTVGSLGKIYKEAGLKLEHGLSFSEIVSPHFLQQNPDFNRFFSALKLSRQLGVSISQTLEVQSSLLRIKQRQKAEEVARRASVLIALPLVLCIFPALLIIYLAPAIINLVVSL